MSDKKKCLIAAIFMGILFFSIFNIDIFAYLYLNYIDVLYGNEGRGITTFSNGIANGAGYFLESYASTMLFMKQVEWSAKTGLNYNQLEKLLDKALVNIKRTNETYFILKNTAGTIPYNPEVIRALKDFDYDGFREDQELIVEVFAEVKKYLANGDICGVYTKILSDTGTIISLLEKVKAQIESGEFPSITDVWNLNHAYSKSLLFGQYVSMVLSRLCKNMV